MFFHENFTRRLAGPTVAAAGIAMLVGALAGGCGPQPMASSGKGNSAPTGDKLGAKANVELTVTDPADLDKVIAEAQKGGKVVLVDFWATWCGPCKENFPHVIDLLKKEAGRGLVVVTYAVEDDPTAAKEDVIAFLTEQKATGSRNLLNTGTIEEAAEKLDIEGGALPHCRVYGRDGKLRGKFVSGNPDKSFDLAEVEKAVADALDEKAP